MLWLQRNAWWLLLTMAVLVAVIGLNPVISGINEDASVPLGITGMSASGLQAESAPGYRLIDFEVRSGGLDLIMIGALLSAVLLFGFRQGRAWAWWVMWTLPIWAVSIFALNLAFGVAPGQAPPTPMISGPIFGVLAAADPPRQRPAVRRAPTRVERVGWMVASLARSTWGRRLFVGCLPVQRPA